MDFEFDFGTTQLTRGKTAGAGQNDGPLVASVEGQVAQLSAEECVFLDRATGQSHVMTLDVLTAMDASRRFLTVQEHTANVEQRVPALKGKGHAIEKVFGFLRERGLLVEAAEMVGKLAQTPSRDLESPRTLVIRTCDRPAQLQRLAASLADYETSYRRGLRYVIVDDSRRTVAENRTALESLREQGLEVHQLDRDWRERFAADLGKVETSRPLLGLADGQTVTCGGAWNTATLLTAGERFFHAG